MTIQLSRRFQSGAYGDGSVTEAETHLGNHRQLFKQTEPPLRSTDNLYLPVETIRNIRHRRLLLLNQDETLSSAVNAKGGYPMGRKRRLRLSPRQ
jgi:hypothetical protein